MVVMQGVRYIEVLHFLRGSAHMRRVHLKVPASSYVMLCYVMLFIRNNSLFAVISF